MAENNDMSIMELLSVLRGTDSSHEEDESNDASAAAEDGISVEREAESPALPVNSGFPDLPSDSINTDNTDANNNTQFVCDTCKVTFTRKGNLARHMRKHVGTMFNCVVCGHTFFTKHALNIHIQVKHKENPFRCKTCAKGYETAYGLKMHESTHTHTEKFICPHCGQGIAYKGMYDAHVARHQGVKPWRCEKCQKQFTHPSHLSSHKNICGVKERAFKCTDCGKLFKAKKYLKDHARIHNSPEHYVCASCGEKFATRGGLYSHTKRKHAK